jgi:hypothetical protein
MRGSADNPSFRDFAKGWESLMIVDQILALGSSPDGLDLIGAVGIEIASPKNKS